MKIDWNTLITIVFAILLASVLNEIVVKKAVAKLGMYEDDEYDYEEDEY